ncbi:MAG: IS3 family transposase [Clostridia bacterium]|nr:IS3 family transposase [Deltaproteobacteria bacterium]
MSMKKRRSFTPEFRREAVRLVLEKKRPAAQVARELGVWESCLFRWVEIAKRDSAAAGTAGAGVELTSDERAELTRLRRENRTLQHERDFLKKANGLFRARDDVKFAVIAQEKAHHPVGVMCRMLGVTRGGFYAWMQRGEGKRARADREMSVHARASFNASKKRYGAPRIAADLRARGVRTSKKRVARIMQEQALTARRRRQGARTTNSNHAFPVAPNSVARQFRPAAMNDTWASDVTYVPTREGWLYFAVVLDLFSRRVVGFATSRHNDAELTCRALKHAQARRNGARVRVHHSDRGSTYAATIYQKELTAGGMSCSMSRRGDCYDNAVVESFFATLKAEVEEINGQHDFAIADNAIKEYIDGFYNSVRLHSTLAYLSPIQFEHQNAAMAA